MPEKALPADELSNEVEQYHAAAAEFIKGNPEPYKQLFSQRDDVTLGNPFGPVGRGWEDVSRIMERAAALYRDGEITGFENVATYVPPELAYIVEVERFSVKISGSEELSDGGSTDHKHLPTRARGLENRAPPCGSDRFRPPTRVRDPGVAVDTRRPGAVLSRCRFARPKHHTGKA